MTARPVPLTVLAKEVADAVHSLHVLTGASAGCAYMYRVTFWCHSHVAPGTAYRTS